MASMHYGFRTGGSPQGRRHWLRFLKQSANTIRYTEHGSKMQGTASNRWRATRAERTVEALPVGDVLVEFPAGHGFLVERKTATDLASSICDGRSSSFENIVAIL